MLRFLNFAVFMCLIAGLNSLMPSAHAFKFSGQQPVNISLNNKLLLKVDSRYCTAIKGLNGYVIATPKLLEQEKLQVYLESELKPRTILYKGHFINSVTSAEYEPKSKTLKIVGHIHPQLSLSINYGLISGNTQIKEQR